MTFPIDTLVYAKQLRKAGFTEQQAEGQAHALAAAMTDALATKQDLRELGVRMDARFAQVEARFEHAERHLDTRLAELTASFRADLAEQASRLREEMAAQGVRLHAESVEQSARLHGEIAEQGARLHGEIAEQGARFHGALTEQGARFHREIADLERRVTLRLGGIMVAGVGVLSVLVTLF
jgi:hypothetical protein